MSEIVCGDCFDFLAKCKPGVYDAVITDPPYASGGLRAPSRRVAPSKKYIMGNSNRVYPEFKNDGRDQRSHMLWSAEWMRRALRATRDGGWLMVFTDWRQLPLTSDAVQIAGWTWRGIVVWDKTEGCRPSLGAFRNQQEYVVVATNGDLGPEQSREVRDCPAGVYREHLRSSEKMHMTGKPVGLMRHLMRVLKPGASILDPFAGSGTTVVAATRIGHECTGVEMSPEYAEIARGRLRGEKKWSAGNTLNFPADAQLTLAV
ncbi:MAG: site-specific DNA-methyltransferase [Opitutales bacterium]|nr:site-specific DNA-methyltransferase [Opitutales bacterium]